MVAKLEHISSRVLVRYPMNCGKDMLGPSFSAFGPNSDIGGHGTPQDTSISTQIECLRSFACSTTIPSRVALQSRCESLQIDGALQ